MSAENVVDFNAMLQGRIVTEKSDPREAGNLNEQLAFFIESSVLFNQLANLVSNILQRDEMMITSQAENDHDKQRLRMILDYWCSKYQEVVR